MTYSFEVPSEMFEDLTRDVLQNTFRIEPDPTGKPWLFLEDGSIFTVHYEDEMFILEEVSFHVEDVDLGTRTPH